MMAPLGDDREASLLAVAWRDVGYVKFMVGDGRPILQSHESSSAG